jgi:hypothetical protein
MHELLVFKKYSLKKTLSTKFNDRDSAESTLLLVFPRSRSALALQLAHVHLAL